MSRYYLMTQEMRSVLKELEIDAMVAYLETNGWIEAVDFLGAFIPTKDLAKRYPIKEEMQKVVASLMENAPSTLHYQLFLLVSEN